MYHHYITIIVLHSMLYYSIVHHVLVYCVRPACLYALADRRSSLNLIIGSVEMLFGSVMARSVSNRLII